MCVDMYTVTTLGGGLDVCGYVHSNYPGGGALMCVDMYTVSTLGGGGGGLDVCGYVHSNYPGGLDVCGY